MLLMIASVPDSVTDLEFQYRTPLSVLLHGIALCMDGLAHQLVIICYVVCSGIHVLWKTCCFVVPYAVLSIRTSASK